MGEQHSQTAGRVSRSNTPTPTPTPMPTLALAALGIVYGDLGTSPLYTLQTVIGAADGQLNPTDALGILSLILWSLLLTVSLKYCVFVMRADNHGEGGILALMALLGGGRNNRTRLLAYCGLFGAALLYGDGILTPAISVLSALEGVTVATSALTPLVVPAAVVILIALFASQALGTAKLGVVFGPVMLLWFLIIAGLGIAGIAGHPAVLAAIDPRHAIGFLGAHGLASFVVLGGVFLALTGSEALYADMGHLGRNPIRNSWYGIVLPALVLSYAGQVAFLLGHPGQRGNPFFLLVPGWAIYPMVGLATLATIIASQAIITGAFSLTRQATQLGWLPGLRIRQTSDTEFGQIYVPLVNWVMMAATVALTVSFGHSERLAGAYGTAISTTMLLTTALLYAVMRERWCWPMPAAMAIAGGFLVIDLAFFAANLLKIADGGWIPLLLGAVIFTLMVTWHSGIAAMRQRHADVPAGRDAFLARLGGGTVARSPGIGVFLTRSPYAVSQFMVQQLDQFGVLPQTLVSMTVQFEQTPRVAGPERVEISEVSHGLWAVTVHFGFMEFPNMRRALEAALAHGCPIDLTEAVFFAAHDEPVSAQAGERLLPRWQCVLFDTMGRNALHPTERFDLPAERFLMIGRRLEI